MVELEKPSTDLPGQSWEIGAFDCSYKVVVLHKETVLTRGLFRAGLRFSLSPSALTGAVAAHDSLNTLPIRALLLGSCSKDLPKVVNERYATSPKALQKV